MRMFEILKNVMFEILWVIQEGRIYNPLAQSGDED